MKNTNTITLNLGLLSNKEFDGLTETQIIKGFKGCLKLYNINVISGKIAQSNTEKTLVAQLEINSVLVFNIQNVVATMCKFLEQDAIAYKHNDKGYLIYNSGFNAEEMQAKKMQWGDFNQEYFIEL